MSELIDPEAIKLMIDETAGDIDGVVLPEDGDVVISEALDAQMKALGKKAKKSVKWKYNKIILAKAEIINEDGAKVTVEQAFTINKAARLTPKKLKVKNFFFLIKNVVKKQMVL